MSDPLPNTHIVQVVSEGNLAGHQLMGQVIILLLQPHVALHQPLVLILHITPHHIWQCYILLHYSKELNPINRKVVLTVSNTPGKYFCLLHVIY